MELSKPSVTIRRVFGAILLLPVVLVVWYDQTIGGLIVVVLALFMSLEAKRINKYAANNWLSGCWSNYGTVDTALDD